MRGNPLVGRFVDQSPQARKAIFIRYFREQASRFRLWDRKYLASGLIHGIGKTYANKIVDHFGADTLRVISEESARLREIEGIGAKRVKSIKEAWAEQKAVREVMMFLQTYGVTDALCLRLVRKYGNEAKSILENDPYRIIREVKGIGFKTADRIALNLGLSNNGPERIEAGVLHAMQETEEAGHTHVERRELALNSATLLETEANEVESRIDVLLSDSHLVPTEPDWLQLPGSDRAEQTLAKSLRDLLHSPSPSPHTDRQSRPMGAGESRLWLCPGSIERRQRGPCLQSFHPDRRTGHG